MAKPKETAVPVTPSFEDALLRLEEIVQRLETGEASLEESLTLFEEGIKLARLCSGQLDGAEGKLRILLGFEGREPQTGDFKMNTEES
jgi:exodeoxyribonuclease VII small subunit